MKQFTASGLELVQSWLRAEEKQLHDARMVIECGDDYFMTNNKWPRVREIMAEETAVRQLQKRACRQLGALRDITNGA